MSSEEAKKDYPDKDQRLAVANSIWKRKDKKEKFTHVYGYEIKEDMNGNLVRGGYIATTHLDSGFYDPSRDKFIRDKIDRRTLERWADEINQGNPRSNKVSVNHNREPHVAGVALKGSARVDLLPDGEYGLYVDTLIDKTREDYTELEYRLDNGLLDSFSIEFTTKDPLTGEYIEGAVSEDESDIGIIRSLMPGTVLEGYTLASQPMNEHAVMIKEVLPQMKEKKEDVPADEEPEDKKEPAKEADNMEEDKKESTAVPEVKTISDEDMQMLKELRAEKEKKKVEEMKEKEYKEILDKVKEDLKKDMGNISVEDKTMKNTDTEVEVKEVKDYNALLEDKGKKKSCGMMDYKISIDRQLEIAGKLADKLGFTNGMIKSDVTTIGNRQFKNFSTNGNLIEAKGLSITTNQNTDTDYLLSAAELADVFDPVIYNILNQKTTTWNLLMKEDYSNKGNNQVQFTLKIGRNATRGFYNANAVSTGNTDRQKYMTKFKKCQVGVEVDGDMIAAARGGPVGDVFAQEVRDATDDLMELMNSQLFAETGAETAAEPIGFEYITDQAGNTSLYNLTRTQANGLASTDTTDNYINANGGDISPTLLRQAKRKSVGTEGADLNNLVFVTSFVQGDKFRGIYDSQQRTVPTSSRFGFEGRPEFDGIPIFEDKDCNDDDWFLVDLETHKIAIWVPPTLEMMGKRADNQEGFMKSYYAVYNKAPRRMVQIYGAATS